MRSRILPAVGASALALVAAAAFAPGASASHGVSPAHQTAASHLRHVQPNASCVSQRDNDNGVGIVSQNFEPSFDIYDSQGADDFSLSATCRATKVGVDGVYFNGSGPADSVNVIYYRGKGKPGTVKKDDSNATYTDTSGFGSFLVKAPARLAAGHYWVSVQANMNFSSGGEWGWNTNNTVRGKASHWQNPGDGFATGCTTWGVTTTCIPSGEGGDNSFSITGR